MDAAPRWTLPLFLLLIAVIGGGLALLLLTPPPAVEITILPPPPTATAEPSATPAPLTVYVTGAVGQPDQMVRVAAGSRAADAIAAAGGLTADADRTRVNLAAVLRDGDQIHVPAVNDVPVRNGIPAENAISADAALPTSSAGMILNINTATLDELIALPRIGDSLAAAILAYRTANGPFADLDALDAVPGIGPALLETLAPLIRFD